MSLDLCNVDIVEVSYLLSFRVVWCRSTAMANAQAIPIVSLSLDKVTKATPLDLLHLLTIHNYSDWLFVNPQTNRVEIRQVQPLVFTTADNRQWELKAKMSTDQRCHQFTLTLVTPINVEKFKFEVAMGVINASGKLFHLSKLRRIRSSGRPPLPQLPQFCYKRGKLRKLTTDGDLKLVFWISHVPIGLSSEVIERQFGCQKDNFLTFQSTVKGDLLNTDKSDGLQRYASQYHINLETFERIFDSGWLPSCFDFDDSTTNCVLGLWLINSTVLIHSYPDWIGSRLPFHYTIRSTCGGHEFHLTVTPGCVALGITLTTAHLDGRRFEVHYGFGLGIVDDFELSQKGSAAEDFGRISSPRSIWDRNVVNNCIRLKVSVRDIHEDNLEVEVSLVSNQGMPVGFKRGMFANSAFIQDMMTFTKPNEYGWYSLDVPFDTATLIDLLSFLITEDVNYMSGNWHPYDYINFSTTEPLERLKNVYKAADFLLLTDVKNKVETILGYKPELSALPL